MKKAWLSILLALAACGPLPAPIPRTTPQPAPAYPTLRPTARPTRTSPPPTATKRRPARTRTPAASKRPTTASRKPTAAPGTPTLPFRILSSVTATLPVPTPTLESASPPPTPTEPLALDCKLIWQSPPSGVTYERGDKFSVGWNIRNTGTTTWEPNSFTFTYLAGAKLATHDSLIPLQESVAPGNEVVLSVPMVAPMTPNPYTTHWGIRQGDVFFCRLTLTIYVP